MELTYQYAGQNACTGMRFEKTVEEFGKTNPAVLARLQKSWEIDEDGERLASSAEIDDVYTEICHGVLKLGGFDPDETISQDIYDLGWLATA